MKRAGAWAALWVALAAVVACSSTSRTEIVHIDGPDGAAGAPGSQPDAQVNEDAGDAAPRTDGAPADTGVPADPDGDLGDVCVGGPADAAAQDRWDWCGGLRDAVAAAYDGGGAVDLGCWFRDGLDAPARCGIHCFDLEDRAACQAIGGECRQSPWDVEECFPLT